MEWYEILSLFIMFLGAMNLVYQIFKMTELDAQCRGLKRPKFWGLFATSGQNSSGLVLYLIGRRKYTAVMSEAEKNELEAHKKKAGVSLIFMMVGTIGFMAFMIL